MKKIAKELLILSTIGALIAAVVSVSRMQPALGGEFCLPILLPLIWLWICQICDDLN